MSCNELEESNSKKRTTNQDLFNNFSTFVETSKWLKHLMIEEKVHAFLAKHHIKWQFNLNKAPSWGAQVERIVGLVKQSLYKVLPMIKMFRGGGVVDGEGGSSERCLKWGGGGGRSLRDLSKNILKQGMGKRKSCS